MSNPIPVSLARQISDSFAYDQVIIIAIGDYGTHTATYGREEGDKRNAADLGSLFVKWMGWTKNNVYEDYRTHLRDLPARIPPVL